MLSGRVEFEEEYLYIGIYYSQVYKQHEQQGIQNRKVFRFNYSVKFRIPSFITNHVLHHLLILLLYVVVPLMYHLRIYLLFISFLFCFVSFFLLFFVTKNKKKKKTKNRFKLTSKSKQSIEQISLNFFLFFSSLGFSVSVLNIFATMFLPALGI